MTTTVTSLACVCPGCETKIPAEKAWVPEIRAIRQAEGGKPIVPSDLVRHVHCDADASFARQMKVKMFRYLDTVAEMEKRAEERARVRGHFAKYALPAEPATVTTMGKALQKAGVPNGQNGKVLALSAP